MKKSTVFVITLLAILTAAFGQTTTSTDSRCTYMFNVPASECSQTSGSSVDDQLLKSSVVGIQAQIKSLVNELKDVRAKNDKMTNELRDIRNENENMVNETIDLQADNIKLRHELATFTTGKCIICGTWTL